MRQLVYAVLPLGEGRILDPFVGGGSTLAAAEAVGYNSIGVEIDEHYFQAAIGAIPLLSALYQNVNTLCEEPENRGKLDVSPLQTQLF
jgi:site-specific DNA-methyltransferase (adenine-specific)